MNKIGYILEFRNEQGKRQFKLKEAPFTRTITSKSDKIRSKLFSCAIDYEDIKSTTDILKENPKIMIVREPFLLDDELKEKAEKWVDWANNVDESKYDFFAQKDGEQK